MELVESSFASANSRVDSPMAESRRRQNSSMATLPIDLLFNILIRLPVTSLLRLKSVCKSWYFLITSPDFANHHLCRNSLSSDRLLIFSGEDLSLYSINLQTLESPPIKIPFPTIPERFDRKKIVGSCNGLLLCICIETLNFEALLLNSSSLSCKRIPKLEVPLNCLYINYGLGYDCRLEDYKILRIVHFISGSVISMQVMIYSLRSDLWKLVKNNFPVYWNPKSQFGVLVNRNLLHWLFPCSSLQVYRIAGFDVCSEEWSEVPMVDDLYISEYNPVDLGILDGCLSLLIGGKGVNFGGLNVWIMKEYGVKDSWVKLFDFTDLGVIGSLSIAPIASCQEGSEILLRKEEFSRVFWYSLSEKRVKGAEIHGLPDTGRLSTCIRTLIRPSSNDRISHESWPMSRREGFH